MIGNIFITRNVKLVKVYNNSHFPVHPSEAFDGKFVTAAESDGSLALSARARPYLSDPYETYFCKLGSKCPSLDGYSCPTNECKAFDHEGYWTGYGAALLTGKVNGFVVVDIDPRNVPNFINIKATMQMIRMKHGALPKTWSVRTPRGGIHLYYRWHSSFPTCKIPTLKGVDFLGDNAKVLIPPYSSSHGIYQWIDVPSENTLADLPAWVLCAQLQQRNAQALRNSYTGPKGDDYDAVKRALDAIPINDCYGNNDLFVSVGYACCSNGYEDLFVAWSRSDENPDAWVKPAQLAHFRKKGPVKLGTLFKLASEYGFNFKQD